MTSKNDNALAIARKILDRLMCRITRAKPTTGRSSVTLPDPTADEGLREVVARSTDR